MDLNEFRNAILGANSNNPEQQSQCHNFIVQFRRKNFHQYITSNIMLVANQQDPTSACFAVTLIFSEAKTGNLFEDEDTIANFWNLYITCVPVVFQSAIFPHHIKIIVSNTVALFAIHVYNQTKNTFIQQFILKLFEEHPEYETYIINCIMEIVVGCEEMGGFPPQIISQFLVAPLRNENSYVPRCKLFFAVAMNAASDPNLSNLYISQYSSIPPQFLKDVLIIIDTFAEKSASFFEPHLGTIIPFLCSIGLDRNCEHRNLALYCLGSIAQCDPNMCHHHPEFFQPVIHCLIQVMSEINDDTPFEYDPNNLESCTVASDVLKAITESSEDIQNYYSCVDQICIQTLQMPQGAPWPCLHAIVSALFDMNPGRILICQNDDDGVENPNYQPIRDFVSRFIPFLTNPQTHQRVRIAIYKLYSLLSTSMLNYFQNGVHDILLPVLKVMVTAETVKEVQIASAEALKSFFKQVLPSVILKFFPQTFEEIITILQHSPPYLYRSLVQCISYFASVDKLFYPYLASYVSVLQNLYSQTTDIRLRFTIIISMTNAFFMLKKTPPDVYAVLLCFLNDTITLIQNNRLDETSHDCYTSIMNILHFLGHYAAPFVSVLLPKALERATEEIQINQYQQFESVESSSMLIKIPSLQTGMKCYALTSDVKTVVQSLQMMRQILTCLSFNIRPHLYKYIAIVQKWITCQYYIPEVTIHAWYLLYSIIINFIEQPEIMPLIPLVFDNFNISIGTGPKAFNKEIINIMTQVVELAHSKDWVEQSRITELLSKLILYADQVLVEKTQFFEKIHHFLGDQDTKEMSLFNETLDKIAYLFEIFLNCYTELSVSFIQQNYLQQINSYLLSPTSIIYGIDIMTFYIVKVNDLPTALSWIACLFDIGIKCDETSIHAFNFLIKVLSAYLLPQDFALKLQSKFEEFLQNPELGEQDNLAGISDAALAAFTVFIQKNTAFIDNDSALNTWCQAFPVWKENETSNYVYEFLASMYENRSNSVFSEENFGRFLSNVINVMGTLMMSNEITERFGQIIRNLVNDPIHGRMIVEYFSNELNPNQKLFIDNIICGSPKVG
ncbi:hypothetical protein TRFO_36619 [Tritrichomonas foetus]|uniref:Importin N-terminal domain-containing protein n=1 Tax=Tritrichomonas foetus TaxID=1144522 RepID=A0A1J4JEV7_9EUKA|nr:hypothetical protein TRFO_36619 [Tritrichomonas foetus]|eukprot:OHS97201.1 hypothetical protein TRFO_36619 [Tritrichomonas foetus]